MPARKKCKHCHEREPAQNRRGMCRRCYDTPRIRRLYPAEKWRNGVRTPGYLIGNTPGRMPLPTAALPGSAEKIAVMEARVLAGERLFCELDGKVDLG